MLCLDTSYCSSDSFKYCQIQLFYRANYKLSTFPIPHSTSSLFYTLCSQYQLLGQSLNRWFRASFGIGRGCTDSYVPFIFYIKLCQKRYRHELIQVKCTKLVCHIVIINTCIIIQFKKKLFVYLFRLLVHRSRCPIPNCQIAIYNIPHRPVSPLNEFISPQFVLDFTAFYKMFVLIWLHCFLVALVVLHIWLHTKIHLYMTVLPYTSKDTGRTLFCLLKR